LSIVTTGPGDDRLPIPTPQSRDERGGASRRFQFTLKGLLCFVTILAAVLWASRALGPQVSLEFLGFFESLVLAATVVALVTPLESVRRSWPAYTDPFVSAGVTVVAYATFLAFDILTRQVQIEFNPAGAVAVLVVAFVIFVVVVLAEPDVVPRRETVRLVPFPYAANVMRALTVRRYRLRLILATAIILALYSMGVASRYAARSRYGLEPPLPTAGGSMAFWGLIWLADSWARPGKIGWCALIYWLCVGVVGEATPGW
jgi:hypothetical protein